MGNAERALIQELEERMFAFDIFQLNVQLEEGQ
jgi:hypothetical protein